MQGRVALWLSGLVRSQEDRAAAWFKSPPANFLLRGGASTIGQKCWSLRTPPATRPRTALMTDRCADLCIPLPPGDEFSVWNLLWISQPDVAGQMLYFCFGDPNYTVNCGVPIDPALALMAAVDRGILYGMNYVEVHQTDAKNLPTAITYAHNLLNPP